MSTCISREGEYSDHEPGDWCPRCGAFNEEAIVAERDALRAQLDGMTVEKATVPQFVTDKDTCDNRLDLLPRPRGHFEFPLMKRLVGPWMDAEGVSDGQQ